MVDVDGPGSAHRLSPTAGRSAAGVGRLRPAARGHGHRAALATPTAGAGRPVQQPHPDGPPTLPCSGAEPHRRPGRPPRDQYGRVGCLCRYPAQGSPGAPRSHCALSLSVADPVRWREAVGGAEAGATRSAASRAGRPALTDSAAPCRARVRRRQIGDHRCGRTHRFRHRDQPRPRALLLLRHRRPGVGRAAGGRLPRAGRPPARRAHHPCLAGLGVVVDARRTGSRTRLPAPATVIGTASAAGCADVTGARQPRGLRPRPQVGVVRAGDGRPIHAVRRRPHVFRRGRPRPAIVRPGVGRRTDGPAGGLQPAPRQDPGAPPESTAGGDRNCGEREDQCLPVGVRPAQGGAARLPPQRSRGGEPTRASRLPVTPALPNLLGERAPSRSRRSAPGGVRRDRLGGTTSHRQPGFRPGTGPDAVPVSSR